MRKLDRLKNTFKGAANEAPTCVVPMYDQQTSSLWRRGVGEWAARVKWGAEGGYSQGHYEGLPRGVRIQTPKRVRSHIGLTARQ